MTQSNNFLRTGTIAIAGLPNAGKSTLLNALVGEPLAITSPKPQATRIPVVGILNDSDSQLVFIDQPGFIEPGYLMQQAMLDAAAVWLKRADAVLHLCPEADPFPKPLGEIFPVAVARALNEAVVRTKTDLSRVEHPKSVESLDDRPVFRVSAKGGGGSGLDEVVRWCKQQVPMGPARYDTESLSTQPEHFFVSEFVREAAFHQLGQELPYSLAAEVEEFREDRDPVYIRVTMYVERESQKGMVVGKGGRAIKALGAQARLRIEELLARPVYLDLWVKVWPKWRSKPEALRRFGFTD